MQEEAVRAALESGAWREKKDPKSGRTYYTNAQTRVSVWNLAKELAKPQQRQTSAEEATLSKLKSLQSLGDERKAQAKQWQAEEEALMQLVTELEREKAQLESEITIMRGPTEAEAAALQEEQKRLQDAKQSFEVVVSEELRKQEEKTAELHQLQARLVTLRQERQEELEVFESLSKRLGKLREEHAEVLTDLRHEEAVEESLQDELQREERELEDALREEARLKEFLKLREDEVDRMKAELKSVCQRRAAQQQQYQRLVEEVAGGEMEAAEDTVGEPSGSSSLRPCHLQREVATQKRNLQRLRKQQHLGTEAEWMDAESAELRRFTALTEREVQRLAQFSRELSDQTRAVTPLLEAIKREVRQLEEEEEQQWK
ncbi:hypothetical protein TraAM80_04740 [Trypanosoma rangeli]|uniref:WW domain-containing protein n=1 Tax=Trypanosoma rangeli TaxID=5698 RepID=A0A3R7KC09_TRYRA|nr:uncharacterized protein TraAM80_04740 [Trypanosoma rangeli]RNF05093.1 hypothetical protein TraAM80_04740 [Trypanosoma rangeli]|eukprot:RNF05093.1 hypothetical protein TraAM80_04740 [Trypanosoma rangeli]